MNLRNLNVIKTPKALKSKFSNSRIKKLFKKFEKNFEKITKRENPGANKNSGNLFFSNFFL